MIISDQHRYLFVELPFTASTAISSELRELYAGRSILGKHSTYREFLRYARPEHEEYYVFSGVRNPLSEIVSRFVQYRTNPDNMYTEPEWWVTRRMIRRFRWVQRRDPSFLQYLARFYQLPYENWASLDHSRFDTVYRLEKATEGFREIMTDLGIEPVRDLPVVHATKGKRDDWRAYYTPEVQDRARWVFGPFMQEWGYSFPDDWRENGVPRTSRLLYRAIQFTKNRARLLRGARSHYPPERLP